MTGGFGGELAARIADQAFEHLDAPVRRVAAYDCPAIPFAAELDEVILPQTSWIEEALEDLLSY